ncbi:unnamed protein product, partial [Polarella glacialis]
MHRRTARAVRPDVVSHSAAMQASGGHVNAAGERFFRRAAYTPIVRKLALSHSRAAATNFDTPIMLFCALRHPVGHRTARGPQVQLQTSAKMLIDAPRHRCSNEALSIASMLCVLPVFLRPNDAFRAANEAKARFAHMDGDHLTLLNIFHAYKQMLQDGQDPAKFCAENFISLRALRAAEVAREHLKKAMESIGLQMVSTDFQDK